MSAPRRTTTVNASLNPISCAIKPIMGGPTKKPTNPTLLTAANAAEGIMLFSFVANMYTTGKTEDTPNPTKANPMITSKGIDVDNDNTIPTAIRMPFPFSTVL